jgi:hypothetical protein
MTISYNLPLSHTPAHSHHRDALDFDQNSRVGKVGHRDQRAAWPWREVSLTRLAQAASDALDTPALHQRWLDMGERTPEPNERTPEYLTKLLPVEIERWRAPIRASGVLIE